MSCPAVPASAAQAAGSPRLEVKFSQHGARRLRGTGPRQGTILMGMSLRKDRGSAGCSHVTRRGLCEPVLRWAGRGCTRGRGGGLAGLGLGHAVPTAAEPHEQLRRAVCWVHGTRWPRTASSAWDLVTAPRTAGKAGGRRPRGRWGPGKVRMGTWGGRLACSPLCPAPCPHSVSCCPRKICAYGHRARLVREPDSSPRTLCPDSVYPPAWPPVLLSAAASPAGQWNGSAVPGGARGLWVTTQGSQSPPSPGTGSVPLPHSRRQTVGPRPHDNRFEEPRGDGRNCRQRRAGAELTGDPWTHGGA